MTLFAITDKHWPTCRTICFIFFVKLLFPYWLWRRVIPYTLFRIINDAYFFMAPDPTIAFVGWSVLSYALLCRCCFRIVIMFNTSLFPQSIFQGVAYFQSICFSKTGFLKWNTKIINGGKHGHQASNYRYQASN
jgi:hypothetical protein